MQEHSSSLVVGKELFAMPGANIAHPPPTRKATFFLSPLYFIKTEKQWKKLPLTVVLEKKRRLEKSETKGWKIGLDNKVKYFGEKGTIKGHKPPLDAISACLNSDLPKQFWGAHSLLSFKIGIAITRHGSIYGERFDILRCIFEWMGSRLRSTDMKSEMRVCDKTSHFYCHVNSTDSKN